MSLFHTTLWWTYGCHLFLLLASLQQAKTDHIFNTSERTVFAYWYGLQPQVSEGFPQPAAWLKCHQSAIKDNDLLQDPHRRWNPLIISLAAEKGRRAQAAGVRGPHQDYGLLASPDNPGSRRLAAPLIKQCFDVISVPVSGCLLGQRPDYLR